MSETAEEQRNRLGRKRLAEANETLIKCLECSLYFRRVGSHVVQVHGYSSTLEYRREHGLMAKETRLESHATLMRRKLDVNDTGLANLSKGEATRYVKGGDHGARVSKFWFDRKDKSEYKKLNSNLRGEIK